MFESTFSNSWVGRWAALDEWQSEFNITIKEDGSAVSDYGNGEKGNWKVVDGNLEISWDNGIVDYLFNGVMGFQRIRKKKGNSSTTGLRRLFD